MYFAAWRVRFATNTSADSSSRCSATSQLITRSNPRPRSHSIPKSRMTIFVPAGATLVTSSEISTPTHTGTPAVCAVYTSQPSPHPISRKLAGLPSTANIAQKAASLCGRSKPRPSYHCWLYTEAPQEPHERAEIVRIRTDPTVEYVYEPRKIVPRRAKLRDLRRVVASVDQVLIGQ